jgi:hypothetical protein
LAALIFGLVEKKYSARWRQRAHYAKIVNSDVTLKLLQHLGLSLRLHQRLEFINFDELRNSSYVDILEKKIKICNEYNFL